MTVAEQLREEGRQEVMQEAIEEGIQKGMSMKARAVALELLKMNLSIESISCYVGLPEVEIAGSRPLTGSVIIDVRNLPSTA